MRSILKTALHGFARPLQDLVWVPMVAEGYGPQALDFHSTWEVKV